MKLGQWKESLAPGELARIAEEHGVRLATFYECINGKKGDDGRKHPFTPTVAVARRISNATGGAVSVAEILGLAEGELATDAEPASSTKPTFDEGEGLAEIAAVDRDRAPLPPTGRLDDPNICDEVSDTQKMKPGHAA